MTYFITGAFVLVAQLPFARWLSDNKRIHLAWWTVGLGLIVFGLFNWTEGYTPIRADAAVSVPIAGSPLNTQRIEQAFQLFGGEIPQ